VTDLLQSDDPQPVGVEIPHGSSPLVFVSDHAGRAIPRRLGDLGLDEASVGGEVATTKVLGAEAPRPRPPTRVVREAPDVAAREIVAFLAERRLI